jgi:hypothetical protein
MQPTAESVCGRFETESRVSAQAEGLALSTHSIYSEDAPRPIGILYIYLVGGISANLLHNMNNKVGIIPVRIQAIQDKYPQLLEADPYLNKSLREIERSAIEAMQIVQENLAHLRPSRMEKIHIAASVATG